jgi:ankyrin repeat protein
MTALVPDAPAAWWAAVEAGDLNRLRALLHEGLDPNLRDACGDTALHRVAADLEGEPAPENVPIARLLVEAGADVNATDLDHRTPLMLAARGGSDEMMGLLRNSGAGTEIADTEGRTALMHAIESAPRVGQLLDHGASVEARDCRGRTALLWAVERSCLKTVEALLERGADLRAADEQGETALHVAVRQASDHELTLQTLEADATSEDPKYAPAHRLLWLVRERADLLREIVRLLVQHGAKADVPDGQGVTPLAYAHKAHGKRLPEESNARRRPSLAEFLQEVSATGTG